MNAVREGMRHLTQPVPDLRANRRCITCGRTARWFADECDEAGHLWCECGCRWDADGRNGWRPIPVDTLPVKSRVL